jgi:hypothetical protein
MRAMLTVLLMMALTLIVVAPVHAGLEYYNTWNGWGELGGPDGDDQLNWTGATCRDEAGGNWRVAIWKLRHEEIAAQSNSSFTWTDNQTYHFTYVYNRTTGDTSYTLDGTVINGTGGPTISGNADANRPFNMVYVYVKNKANHLILMNNLYINGVALNTVPGFDGELRIGDNGNSHETVKFIDTGDDRLLAGDTITISGDFELVNPSGSQGDKMQISAKLLYDPDLESSGTAAVPAVGLWGFIALAAGMMAIGGLKRRRVF